MSERDLDRNIDASLARQYGAPQDLEETARSLVARARMRPAGDPAVGDGPAPARRDAAAAAGIGPAAAMGLVALAASLAFLVGVVLRGAPEGGGGGGVEPESVVLRPDLLFARHAPPSLGQSWVEGPEGVVCREPEERFSMPLGTCGDAWSTASVDVLLQAGDSMGEVLDCPIRPGTAMVPARLGDESCVLLVDPVDSGIDWVCDPEGELRSHEWVQDGLRFCEVNARDEPLLRPRIEP